MAEKHPADLIKPRGITITMKEMYLSPALSHLEEVLSGLLGALGKNYVLLFLFKSVLGLLRCINEGVSRSSACSSVPSPLQNGKVLLPIAADRISGGTNVKIEEAGKARC